MIGDCATTSTLALAATWPVDDIIVLEADRAGGSLAAWLGTPVSPSLSSIVAQVRTLHDEPAATWTVVESMIQRTPSGRRFIAAPVRSREASRSVSEASAMLFPVLARMPAPTLLADLGRWSATDEPPVLVALATSIVIVHRQHRASATAAAVRLERLAEQIAVLSAIGPPVVLAVIGDQPFGLDEIGGFVSDHGRHEIHVSPLADDELSAAVFAGRAGVSGRRLARLPLSRSARSIAEAIAAGTSPDDDATDNDVANRTAGRHRREQGVGS